jgi:hypothetical protein
MPIPVYIACLLPPRTWTSADPTLPRNACTSPSSTFLRHGHRALSPFAILHKLVHDLVWQGPANCWRIPRLTLTVLHDAGAPHIMFKLSGASGRRSHVRTPSQQQISVPITYSGTSRRRQGGAVGQGCAAEEGRRSMQPRAGFKLWDSARAHFSLLVSSCAHSKSRVLIRS